MKKRIGIYNPHLDTMGGGEKVCVVLAEVLSKKADVELISHKKIDKEILEKYFSSDLSKVKMVVLTPRKFYKYLSGSKFLPGAIKKIADHLSVFKPLKKLNLDIFINNYYQSELPSPAKNGIYMCMFPHKLIDPKKMSSIKSLYHRLFKFFERLIMHASRKSWLDTYALFTANSQYTQKYIKKYWGKDSEVIYPICEDMKLSNIKKEKIIMNVGRFFENNGVNHHKRQDLLVDTFCQIKDLQKDGWELHLVGSVAKDLGGYEFVYNLIKKAGGLPIHFHFDAPFEELRELYNKTSIYWHATGYGSDPKKYPERQEHFGITTVEAMSAGCTPVVINTAGQKEIIIDNINGYLWSTPRELISNTKVAILKPIKQKELDETVNKFNKKSFELSVDKIIKGLI